MTELTLGQTVARDVMMAIAFWHGVQGGRHLGLTAQTGDEREEVFHRIADAVDKIAEAARYELEEQMMMAVSTGSLGDTVSFAFDFEAAAMDALETVGFDADKTRIIMANMPRSTPRTGG